MPSSLRRVAILAALVLVAVGAEFALPVIIPDTAWRVLVTQALVSVVVALSLNVINGMAGQFSIGHAGFVGIGAYTGAVVSSQIHRSLGSPDYDFATSFLIVPPALIAAGLMAGLFGFLVGLPSLRLRGDYLAIVTLGFAEIFRLVIATAQAGDAGAKTGVLSRIGASLSALGCQNGYQGIANQGVPLYAGPFWVFGLAFVLGVVAWRIKFSGWGRALRALREDEIAAAAVGVDPTRYKVTSFVIAAIGAGIAGGLMAIMRDGIPVNPDNYNFQASFDAITMVILGGSGSVSGAAIGGLLITFTIKAIELVQGTRVVQDLKASFESLDLNALRMIIYAVI